MRAPARGIPGVPDHLGGPAVALPSAGGGRTAPRGPPEGRMDPSDAPPGTSERAADRKKPRNGRIGGPASPVSMRTEISSTHRGVVSSVYMVEGSFRPTHFHADEVMATTPAPTREASVRFVPAAPLAPLAHAGRAPPCQGGGTGIVARAVLHSHPRCTRQPRRASNAEDGVRSPADAPTRPAAPSDTLPLCSERRSVARVVRLTSHRLTATME